ALQLPSFARRSNILTGLQDPAVDNRPKLDLSSSGKSQQHQYELNSKKYHQYQPNGKESSMKHQSHSKGKYYYQLNSKKHHHYQPDPKMYEPHYQPTSKEPQSQACLESSKSPMVAHPDKWAHAPAKSLLGPVKNLSAESKNGAEKNLSSGTGPPPRDRVTGNGLGGKMKIVKNKNKNGRIVIVMSKYMENGMQAVKIKSGEPARKRAADERTPKKGGEEKLEVWRKPGEDRVAGSKAEGPPARPAAPGPPAPPEVILLDSDLDEPIDLRCVKPRAEGEPAAAQVKPEAPLVPSEKPPAEPPQPHGATEEEEEEEAEALQEFKPFFGNIIITDVTANCLTVTFKEYVTV
ncbi:E3 SUMO-protein ligase CBX4, partial [Tinamus guttatus]